MRGGLLSPQVAVASAPGDPEARARASHDGRGHPFRRSGRTSGESTPTQYARRRNHTDGGTRISAFLTRGLVTLPEVRDDVLDRYTAGQAYKFVFELAWREYWQREWTFRGDAIFSDIKRPQYPVSSRRMPRAVLEADTGIDALDAAIRGLYDTGYMHNHERMWLAGLICNTARTHWWEPSRWLYYHLLDGDPASNSLSWQWVAGTFSHKKYIAAQANINKYSAHPQHGTYLDHDYGVPRRNGGPRRAFGTHRPRSDLDAAAERATRRSIRRSRRCSITRSGSTRRGVPIRTPTASSCSSRAGSRASRSARSSPTTSCAARARFPGAQVVVAEFDDLQLGDDVHFMRHPSVPHWRGTADEMPRLFPHVPDKSYASFTSYWKQCQKTTK